MKHLLAFASLLVLAAAVVVAQDSAATQQKKKSKNDVEWMELDLGDKTPAISVFYGSGMPSRDGIAGTFESAMIIGGTLGMERTIEWWRDKDIVAHKGNNLYLWYGQGADAQGIITPMSGDVPAQAATTSSNFFRIGITDESGFGYKLGSSSSLTFLVAPATLSWTVVTPQAVLAGDSASAQGLRDFEGGLRFGESMRPAIAFRVAEPVSLRVGYEWSQIYPRHLFWFWLLSQGIEGIADAGATWFAREIGKSSPAAMPIIYFLLRNGVAAGFKALRMNQMNWPFTTEAPLNIQMWNVGVDIHF